ncbi:hypothetical protein D3C81_1086830 [compost metagenome]
MPSACSSASVSSDLPMSFIAAVSVISSVMAEGGMSCWWICSSRYCGKFRLAKRSPDTLIATGTMGSPASCHWRTCAQTVAMTQSSSLSIWPDCSATMMNSAGLTAPSVGWRQRHSASAPTTRRVFTSNFGWYISFSPSSWMASQRSRRITRMRRARSPAAELNTRTWLEPLSRASARLTRAACISASEVCASRG